MKYFTPERIKYFSKAYQQLKKYKGYSILIVILSLAVSVFEGFSLGMIIPFFQNLANTGKEKIFLLPIFQNAQQALLNGNREETVLKILLFALIMIILKSIFNYLRIITISRARTLIRRDMQNNIFYHACDANLQFYTKIKSGNLVSSVSVYSNQIVGFYLILLNSFANIAKIIVYGLLLLFISWKFTLVILILELLILPLLKKIFTKIKQVSMQTTKEWAKLHSQMIERFNALKLIQIFSTENYEKNKFNKISTALANLDFYNNRYMSLVTPLTEVSVMLIIIIIFVASVKIVKINIIFYLPFIIGYLYVFLKIYNEINIFLRALSKLFEKIEPYKAYEKLLNEIKKAKALTGKIKLNKFKNKIEFQHVFFAYQQKKYILQDLNFVIQQGQFIAIIGATGSGKTTIANLVAGLLFPSKGKILVDNIDIKKLDIRDWREKIGYISQDITIFNDTIKNNIIYGYFNAKEKEIEQAARIAGIAKFIKQLPNKYETIVGEQGAQLSGGQRQRLAIARAIIHKPEILILDEATSSLDIETEKQVQQALSQAAKGKTVIAIAHHLSTIKQADYILVLENGQIVEHGKHEELLKNGKYYQNYYQQQ